MEGAQQAHDNSNLDIDPQNPVSRRALVSQYSNIKTHLYCHIIFTLIVRIGQIAFGIYLIDYISKSGLLGNLQIKQLYIWVLIYVLSDFIFFGLVSFFYLAFKQHLYKYAYFKSIFCTIMLTFNFIILGYGAYVVASIPTSFPDNQQQQSYSNQMKSLSVLYIVSRSIIFALITKLQFDEKRYLIPQLRRFSLLPSEILDFNSEEIITKQIEQLHQCSDAELADEARITEKCVICFDSIISGSKEQQKPIYKLCCNFNSNYYHEQCLRGWFSEKLVCPLCRGIDLANTHSPNNINNIKPEVKQENLPGEEVVEQVRITIPQEIVIDLDDIAQSSCHRWTPKSKLSNSFNVRIEGLSKEVSMSERKNSQTFQEDNLV